MNTRAYLIAFAFSRLAPSGFVVVSALSLLALSL